MSQLTISELSRKDIKRLALKQLRDYSLPASAIAYQRGLAKARRLILGIKPIEYRGPK